MEPKDRNSTEPVIELGGAHCKTKANVQLTGYDLEMIFQKCHSTPGKVIADLIGVPEKTYEGYVTALHCKTGCRCIADLIRFGVKHGILRVENGDFKRGWEVLGDGTYRIKK